MNPSDSLIQVSTDLEICCPDVSFSDHGVMSRSFDEAAVALSHMTVLWKSLPDAYARKTLVMIAAVLRFVVM